MSGLGRFVPPDFQHVDKYPLRALEVRPKSVPVVIGVNWYTNFDGPVEITVGGKKRWVVGQNPRDLGSIRGGHCVVLHPAGESDTGEWYHWYNQVSEGCCVGEGCSRAMSLNNRKEYQPWWLYRKAQRLGSIPFDQEGANVRDALEVLRTEGHIRRQGHEHQFLGSTGDRMLLPRRGDPKEGIAAYRWATSADEILHALGTPTLDYVNFFNSWGESYPRVVRMPVETLDRLLKEQGEAGVVTDR